MKIKFEDAWGFSKLDVYRTCPRKFKYQFIDKLPTGSSPAMERGAKVHDGLEGYLNGWTALPPEASAWATQMDELKSHPTVKGEQALGFNKDWSLRKDWYGKECWLRVKMDAYYFDADRLVVIDYKTGKYRTPSTDQVALYSAAGLTLAPHVREVVAEFWYIDQDSKKYTKTYTKDEALALRPKFEAEAQKIYEEEEWPMRPSAECRWCPFSKSKGGPCDF